jgi:hypothetical protein
MRHPTLAEPVARRRSNPAFAASMLLAAALALGGVVGCATEPNAAPPRIATAQQPDDAGLHACAERMHDLAGWLLRFHARHQRMPDSLVTLAEFAGDFDALDRWTCPTSGQPYVYRPSGWPTPETNQRILAFDATAAHATWRTAILAPDPNQPGPVVLRVTSVPANFPTRR